VLIGPSTREKRMEKKAPRSATKRGKKRARGNTGRTGRSLLGGSTEKNQIRKKNEAGKRKKNYKNLRKTEAKVGSDRPKGHDQKTARIKKNTKNGPPMSRELRVRRLRKSQKKAGGALKNLRPLGRHPRAPQTPFRSGGMGISVLGNRSESPIFGRGLKAQGWRTAE